MTQDLIDIGTKSDNPIGKALSNFRNWRFTFEGIECKSLESILQSFKFSDPEEQIKICGMIGYKAKYKGMKANDWKKTQILYWKGKEYPRQSKKYQDLLDSVFNVAFIINKMAKSNLLASGDSILTHSMGKEDPKETVLTEKEFCERLMKLRELIRKEMSK